MTNNNKNIRALVVDDEDHIRNIITRALQTTGFEVVAASNGADALLEFSKIKFDLALLDVKMPGMNGLDVLKQIKSDDPDLKVVMLTGVADNETVQDTATDLGANAFLIKPCSLATIFDAVNSVLDLETTST